MGQNGSFFYHTPYHTRWVKKKLLSAQFTSTKQPRPARDLTLFQHPRLVVAVAAPQDSSQRLNLETWSQPLYPCGPRLKA